MNSFDYSTVSASTRIQRNRRTFDRDSPQFSARFTFGESFSRPVEKMLMRYKFFFLNLFNRHACRNQAAEKFPFFLTQIRQVFFFFSITFFLFSKLLSIQAKRRNSTSYGRGTGVNGSTDDDSPRVYSGEGNKERLDK